MVCDCSGRVFDDLFLREVLLIVDWLKKGFERGAAKRGVEDLDGVHDGQRASDLRERGLELEEAAGIAGDDDVRMEIDDEAGFAFAELSGGFRLNEIVNSSGAAADGAFGNFEEFDAGNGGEQLAGLGANALSVLQMAGIVEGDARG